MYTDLPVAIMVPIAGCLVWVPVTIWVVSMVHWWILGDIESLPAILAIVLSITLGFFTVKPPEPWLAPIFFVMMLGTVCVYPILRSAIVRIQLARIDIDQLENAVQQLRSNPNNTAARLKIAQIAMQRQLPGAAICIAEEAMNTIPRDWFQEEARLLKRWKREVVDPAAFHPLVCPKCMHRNALTNVFCENCASPHVLMLARGGLLSSTFARRLLGAWLVGMVAVVGIPVAAVALPPLASIIVIVLLTVLGVWMGVAAFRRPARV